MKRPLSISIIGWFLVVMSAIGLVGSIATFNTVTEDPMVKELLGKSPIPIPIQLALGFIGPVINIVAGAAMLKGKNWGRLLYVIFSALMLVIGFVTSPIKVMLIPSVIFFLVIAFFLFRPKATAYFTGVEQEHEISA